MERPLPKQQFDAEAKGPTSTGRVGIHLGMARLSYALPTLVALAVLVAVWEAWTRLVGVPVYIMPGPTAVLDRLAGDLGFFLGRGTVTLVEAAAGFALGSSVAFCLAAVMAHSLFLERALFPMAVLLKVTPIVAVAPLFVIWFGFGYAPIVLIAALIAFFPVLVNTLAGLRSVSPDALDVFLSVNASRREVFLKLRVPSSLPYLFAAFRITVPLSVIGAVVGEFFNGSRGLGGVIFVAHHNLDMPTSFAAILVLALMGIGMFVLTAYVERRVLFWHESVITS